MSISLYTANGVPISLGRELGRGGEAAVFEVFAAQNQVAKLYHKAPDRQKQSKLRYMASSVDKELLSHIAWPQGTLHASPNGPVVGFLMHKVVNKEPIHMFYSPAHRRQVHPKAAWDFLIYVSRNVAASFDVVHSHGFAIGDVNQDSFLVGSDSKVSLIDSDSFQIKANNELYLCEVGVPLYTPPELQGMPFHGVTRTANHDNFGLALLIFHVLFGGRHPFAGVPHMKGAGDALETDIAHYRYAYARDFKTRGLSPPPRSIPLSILPPGIEAMFVQAFTESGVRTGRPTANQWVAALDGLRNGLKKCRLSGMHVYPNHLASCPWCHLEKKGVIYFVDFGTSVVSTSSGFVLTQVWGLIQSIPVPAKVIPPTPALFPRTAEPLPANMATKRTRLVYGALALIAAVAFIYVLPKFWFVGLIFLGVVWAMAGTVGRAARAAEKERRSAIYQQAQAEYDRLLQVLRVEGGPERFVAKKVELAKFRDEFQNLPQIEAKAVAELKHTAYERQKHQFLDGCFIDSAMISGVGPTRKAALRSFGIETAADVTRQRVMQVRGFGDSLTHAVLDWKSSCERRFTFNPANAVSDADRNAVLHKYRWRRMLLEKNLMAGPAELKKLYERTQYKRADLAQQLEQAAMRLAQAEADWNLMR